ncbi:MAG: ABC transporter permease [Ignavibacteria bacterium]|nr:ABC transporter permease [Ignavibacteria bacterium]
MTIEFYIARKYLSLKRINLIILILITSTVIGVITFILTKIFFSHILKLINVNYPNVISVIIGILIGLGVMIYLLTKMKINFISVITSISVVGVTIGVAAMITVLSVFNGFNSKVTSILIGFDPHIRIEPKNSDRIDNYNQIISLIDDSRIKYIAQYTLNKAMIATPDFNKVILVKGVDPELIDKVSGLKNSIKFGKFDLQDEGDYGSIVLGVVIASRMKINLGDTITMISPAGLESALTQFVEPVTKKFIVKGLFFAENKEYDSKYVYISLHNAQSLFRMYSSASGIEMRLDNINQSEDVKNKLIEKLGTDYNIMSWYDLHKDFYSILKVERWVAFIILSLIIAVASFNILASLTMTVIQKKRDIGILKAMGINENAIRKIFLFQGTIVGLIGMVVGSLLGLILILIQKYFEVYKLDPTVYLIDALPVEIRLTDFIFVPSAALILCTLAAVYPAKKASKLDPIEAIRWE